MKSQHAAGAIVSDDLKWVAEACEHIAKRLRLARSCKKSSTTPSAAPFLGLLTERDDLKNRCEALTLESQCISWLAAEAKELAEKLADRKKTDATTKTNPKCSGGEPATATDKLVVALEAELAKTKVVHVRLVDISVQSKADAA